MSSCISPISSIERDRHSSPLSRLRPPNYGASCIQSPDRSPRRDRTMMLLAINTRPETYRISVRITHGLKRLVRVKLRSRQPAGVRPLFPQTRTSAAGRRTA